MPKQLIKWAKSKIESININSDEFKSPEVQEELLDLVSSIEEKVIKRSTFGALNSIVSKLELIKSDIENGNHSDGEIEEYAKLAKSINSIAYRIQKIN